MYKSKVYKWNNKNSYSKSTQPRTKSLKVLMDENQGLLKFLEMLRFCEDLFPDYCVHDEKHPENFNDAFSCATIISVCSPQKRFR